MKTLFDIEENTFAWACYEQNTFAELTEAITAKRADKTDCATWQITPTEWRQSVKSALEAKISDLQNTISAQKLSNSNLRFDIDDLSYSLTQQ